ncbi:tRNA pseudouridine38-40 synthase [Anaerotaenia torta]|uniref:tRNA pseudouridine(38-40) synthase TruA n=1 Tax=Anaerotaenia torta TaxID=433293 RepID=UPI003D25753A
MRRIKLVVAYDGTGYCGWQLQPGQPTIEAELNKALSGLLREEIAVIGASRTDSGVHALGNVAVFDTESAIPAEKICPALNVRLPEDIRIQASMEVDLDFHPRRRASQKTYEYRILNCRVAVPTQRLYSAFVYYTLDPARMQEAADYLVGEHDFKSFCSVKTQVTDTVRRIYRAEILCQGENIVIRVTGSGFLYNMVRIIAGTLIEVGRGAYPPDRVKDMLQGCDRSLAGPTALARGLTLVGIEYLE